MTGSVSSPVARVLSVALEEREWPGDAELVEQLTGVRPSLPRVHLDELADALDSLDGGLLDLRTGETMRVEVLDLLEEDGMLDLDRDDPALVAVPGEGPAAAWRDRRVFVDGLSDERARDVLGVALQGSGAFRRFSQQLGRWPELVPSFLALRDERAYGRARQWLAIAGLLRATPEPSPRP